MSGEPVAGHVIRKHTEDGYQDLGRIVHVLGDRTHYWWIPVPDKDAKGKRLKHFIKAPRVEATANSDAVINQPDVSVVPFVESGLPSIPLARLRELAATNVRRDRRELQRSIDIMETQWSWIERLVVGSPIEYLLDTDAVNAYARQRSEDLGVEDRRIVRAVRLYILGGCMKEALLPRWDRCNAVGKPKLPRRDSSGKHSRRAGRRNLAVQQGHTGLAGIPMAEADRVIMVKGWRKYKVKARLSVEQAWALTMGEFYGAEVEVTDKVWKIRVQREGTYPTLHQFRRHGPGTDPEQKAWRVNLGTHRFARNERALHGSTRDRLVAAGQCGQIDSTSDDQNLVLPVDRTVRMPQSFNTKVLESYTGYILGVYSSFERPSTMTALLAIANSVEDKVAFCDRYGILISDDEWLAMYLRHIRGDNGEHKSEEGIASMEAAEVSLEFVQAYAAEMKGQVESAHHSVARAGGHQTAGSTRGERHERGDSNPEADACLTHEEYMPILIRAILRHNNEERVEHLLTIEMREDKVEPYRGQILRWMIKKGYVATELSDMNAVRARCLPRLKAVVSRDGVRVFDPRVMEKRFIPHLRYTSEHLDATGLTGQGKNHRAECTLFLDPSRIGKAWLEYRGLVPVDLLTHDSQMAQLTLLEWLQITDEDRLQNVLAGHRRLEVLASNGMHIYKANEQGRAAKKEQREQDVNAGGKRKPQMGKKDAAEQATRAAHLQQLGLGGVPAPAPASQQDAHREQDSANEPAWVTAARQGAWRA